MSRKQAIVNPDGQVIPCCFFANLLLVADWFDYPQDYSHSEWKKKEKEYRLTNYRLTAFETTIDPVLKDYIKHKDELNIFNDDLENIVNHSWFQRLYESWEDPDKISPICVRNCTKDDM